jgi:FtsP/CotA-like multicopper oxidase with cupredoxin domain
MQPEHDEGTVTFIATALLLVLSAAPAALSTPDWFEVDHKARTVTIKVVAEQANGAWTFNGYANGSATIVVPEGYKVTLKFTNDDFMAHSIGLAPLPTTGWPSMPAPTPVFAGAITPDPASVSGATPQGETHAITFTASKAGKYALVCFIPGHAAARMWIRFNVVAGKEAGVKDGKER